MTPLAFTSRSFSDTHLLPFHLEELMDRKLKYPFSWRQKPGQTPLPKPEVFDCQEVVYTPESTMAGIQLVLQTLLIDAGYKIVTPMGERSRSGLTFERIVKFDDELWVIFKDEEYKGTLFNPDLLYARRLTAEEKTEIDNRIRECCKSGEVFDRVTALRQSATQIWQEFCQELARRFPPSMKRYARGYDWVENPETGRWKLPVLMNAIAASDMEGTHYHTWIVKLDDLEESGFPNLNEMKKAVDEWAVAWSGLVEISSEIEDDEFLWIRFSLVR